MTKEEALDLALEALTVLLDEWTPARQAQLKGMKAVTAIKQARSAPYVASPRVQSCYCPNCEAMGKELAALKEWIATPPAAQPTPVQNRSALTLDRPMTFGGCPFCGSQSCIAGRCKLNTTPPAAQRQWVGLTQQDIDIAFDDTQEGGGFDDFARAIEAKLKEKNGWYRQHVTDGSPCWCEPEISYTDPETGASVIVHKEPQ